MKLLPHIPNPQCPRPGCAARHRLLRYVSMALVLASCRASPLSPAPPASRPRGGGAVLQLDLTPLTGTAPPARARVQWGDFTRIVGTHDAWRLQLPTPPPRSRFLRVRPEGGHRAWYPLRVDLPVGVNSLPVWIPLVPRRCDVSSPYLDLLDLLQDFLYPLSGSSITRWPTLPVRVALPPAGVDELYRSTCREAMAEWNAAASGTWLLAVDSTDSAQVQCTVWQEPELGFARILAWGPQGEVTRLRVHLSPRFHPEFPRYVRRAWAHEFGHALGLWGHSESREHLLHGRAVMVDLPHRDEVAAIRRLYSLPRGFDLRWIQRRWQDRSHVSSGCALRSADAQAPWQPVLHRSVEAGPGTGELGREF